MKKLAIPSAVAAALASLGTQGATISVDTNGRGVVRSAATQCVCPKCSHVLRADCALPLKTKIRIAKSKRRLHLSELP